jgi:hypothetical protein
MAIKIQGVEVISDAQELTGVKFGSDEVSFPSYLGAEAELVGVGANNTLTFFPSPFSSETTGNTVNFLLNGDLNVNGHTIFASNNANISLRTYGSGKTIIDSNVKTKTIDFGYDRSDGSVISKFTSAKATSSSTDPFTFASFDATQIRSMKIVIQAKQTTGDDTKYYYVSELLCFHDDTDAYYSEYATMDTTPNQDMMEVNSKLQNGNFVISIAPGSSDSIEYKFIMQQIVV